MKIAIHPCAAVYPMLPDEELDALAADIQTNGLEEQVVLWRDPAKPRKVYVLDGRNRLAAIQRLGATIEWRRIPLLDVPRGYARFPDGTEKQVATLLRDTTVPDPAAYVITRNIHRRHLTKTQRAELILKTIEAANITTKTKTVETAIVQESAADFSADVAEKSFGRPKDPVLQAAITEAAKHGISKRTVEAARTAMQGKPHVTHNSGDVEWYSPPEYVEAARAVMGGIDLDPASSLEANAVIKAGSFYDIDTDGLANPWHGRVWLNPPYKASLITGFVQKLLTSIDTGDVTEAIVLVNNATETTWFQALCADVTGICFPRGRARYWRPGGGETSSPLQGQAVLYFGSHRTQFTTVFDAIGIVMITWARTTAWAARRELAGANCDRGQNLEQAE